MFNFIETWYFGWNLKPQSPAEMMCDYIANVAMVSGMLIIVYITLFQEKENQK